MKYSTIYREAARLIDAGQEDFSCHAINRATDTTLCVDTPAKSYFLKLFNFGDGFPYRSRNLKKLWLWSSWEPEGREWRVWLLLLAAEVAEDEGN